MLYNPPFPQFNPVIAAVAFKDLSVTRAVLLYVSTHGTRAPSAKYGDEPHTSTLDRKCGGVVTNNRCEQEFRVK
ncbi:hypothetical protein PHET_11761 [Paragonimus heterotremus]|uniref:Uncharacterized protein n=1 Tax=Paragonimus heterotremus TaxID=100268 RepID=A0A8J4T377_9TREM|nr:hypothetical protein PHET_11761 [Paragonimus heterotremus]